MFANLQQQLYQLAEWAQRLVSLQLDVISPTTIAVVALAGLLTSLTPCTLSMLPITLAYIGGSNSSAGASKSIAFGLGLATTLAGMGVFAATVGKVYGQIGIGLPIIVSLVAIIMGLNLLQLLPIPLPDLGNTDWIGKDLPPVLRAYLIGLTFGFVASPCSTPVLATLLAWVASSGNLAIGAVLLFAYTIGYIVPLILAGTFAATLKTMLAMRQQSSWIAPASGGLLVAFGVFSLLVRTIERI